MSLTWLNAWARYAKMLYKTTGIKTSNWCASFYHIWKKLWRYALKQLFLKWLTTDLIWPEEKKAFQNLRLKRQWSLDMWLCYWQKKSWYFQSCTFGRGCKLGREELGFFHAQKWSEVKWSGKSRPASPAVVWHFYKKIFVTIRWLCKKINESIELSESEFNHSVYLSYNELLKYGNSLETKMFDTEWLRDIIMD